MNTLINNTSQKEEHRQAMFLFVIWCLVPLCFPFMLVHLVVWFLGLDGWAVVFFILLDKTSPLCPPAVQDLNSASFF